jgi:hypothetical protein
MVWTILLSIASEIETRFRFSRREEALFIWEILSKYSDISEDFYNKRYRESIGIVMYTLNRTGQKKRGEE